MWDRRGGRAGKSRQDGELKTEMGFREKAEGRGQANGMNRKGLVNG